MTVVATAFVRCASLHKLWLLLTCNACCCRACSLWKVETIGDAYVVAGNLIATDPDHAATVVRGCWLLIQAMAWINIGHYLAK